MKKFYIMEIGDFNEIEVYGESKASVLKEYINKNYPSGTKTKRVKGDGHSDICVWGAYGRTYYIVLQGE